MVAVNYLWNPLSDNIVREFDDAGAVVAEYTTEPEEFGNVVSQRRDGTDSYFHYDGVGSTLALTNDSSMVTDTRAYTAFGESTEQAGSTTFPFQFVGQKGYYLDPEAGDSSIRRRRYSTTYGRWLSPNPLGPIIVVARYTYVINRPLVASDPSGLDAQDRLDCINDADRAYQRCCAQLRADFPCENWCRKLTHGRGLCLVLCLPIRGLLTGLECGAGYELMLIVCEFLRLA